MNEPVRILIVDDSAEHRRLYSRLIERGAELSYAISEVPSAGEGLQQCRSEPPDCLLLDYSMPDIDGLEFLARLGDGTAELPIPVVMLTGEGDELVAVEAMKRGAHDYLVKNHVTPEALQLAVDNAIEKVHMRKMLAAQRLELERLAVTDELTGIHNRRYFVARLAEEMVRSARYNTALTLLLCDLDHFKRVNDKYGHLSGDRVLKDFGGLLSECARGTDIVARYGGEEFAVVLTNTSLESAHIVAERICNRARAARYTPHDTGAPFQVTCSIGMAAHAEEIATTEALVERADAALYRAKRRGRDRICT